MREMHGTAPRCVRSVARSARRPRHNLRVRNAASRATRCQTHLEQSPAVRNRSVLPGESGDARVAPNETAARRQLRKSGTRLPETSDSMSDWRATVRRKLATPAPRGRLGCEAETYGRAIESCEAPSGSEDPQSFASESGRRRSRTSSAPISLDAGRRR